MFRIRWSREPDPFSPDLGFSNLKGANLRSYPMKGADFSGADMADADLHQANLHLAKLNSANLTGANVSETVGVDFKGVVVANLYEGGLETFDESISVDAENQIYSPRNRDEDYEDEVYDYEDTGRDLHEDDVEDDELVEDQE